MPRSLARRLRLIALGCFVLFLALTGGSVAARKHHSADPVALRQKLESLQSKKRSTQRQLRLATQRQNQVTRRLHEIDQRLDKSERRLHGIKQDVVQAQGQLRTAISGLRHATAEVETRQDQAADRVEAISEAGEIKPLEVALDSTSFSDFANRMYLVNEVVSGDADMLDQLSEAQDHAETRRDQVASQERKLDSLRRQEEGVRVITLNERASGQQEKTKILQSRAELERSLEEMAAESRSITAMLQQRQSRNRAIGFTVSPWRGRLAWPVSGFRVSSPFGYRMHPILHERKMHTGIDLAVSYGTPIHAAAGGVVIFALLARWLRQLRHDRPREQSSDPLRTLLQPGRLCGSEGFAGTAHRLRGQHR